MTPIQTNKPLFFNNDGQPLNGEIYIGQPSQDPRTNAKTVTLRDAGGVEFTASQPLVTVNGRIVYNGKPIAALVDGEYSLLVFDSAGAQVDYSASVNAAFSDENNDNSAILQVGLLLADIKGIDVPVGATVRNVGQASPTDGLGADWLAISATGNPADDVDLIDFENGLQGRRLDNQIYRSQFNPRSATLVWSGASETVDFDLLSTNEPGFYVMSTSNRVFSFYWDKGLGDISQASHIVFSSPTTIIFYKIDAASGAFNGSITTLNASTGSVSDANLTINEIYRV